MGQKETDTTPPSSVDFFYEGCLGGFWKGKNPNNYSPVISRWGNIVSSGGIGKRLVDNYLTPLSEDAGSSPVLTTNKRY